MLRIDSEEVSCYTSNQRISLTVNERTWFMHVCGGTAEMNLTTSQNPLLDLVAPGSWIFQVNPKIYDLEGALGELPKIDWLVTSYRKEVCIGDLVFLWEAGSNAGIVALAQVIGEPSIREDPEEEKRFYRKADNLDKPQWRVRLAIKQVLSNRILKERLRNHPLFKEHPICTAPRRTNFRLNDDQAVTLLACIL